MISQRELAERFERGDDPDSIPPASNVEVQSAEGSDDEFEAYIVGYNWAMYAGRTSEGSVVVFTGWHGYSNSTSKQMGQVKGGIGYDNFRESDVAPKVRSEAHAERNNSRSGHGYPGHGYPA
jgi:hypothetical protein